MPIRLFVPLFCLLLLALATSGTAAARQSPAPSSAPPAAQQVPVSGSGEGEGDVADLPPARSVAVMPFSNISKDAADDWIGDGIAETVGADLESLDDMVVIGREMVSSALDEGVPALPDATAAARLGRDLGVGWVVTGGYQRVGQMLRITARLVDAVTGRVAGTLTADGTIDELFALQDRIVAGLLTEAAGSEEPLLPDPDAGGAGDTTELRGAGPIRGGIAVGDDTEVSRLGLLPGRPTVRPTRTDTPPDIDGRLDDVVWRNAAKITEFTQESPLEGAPATEDTEVYIAYDDDNLYFGFYLHYSDPSIMRANRVDRDRAAQDDLITIYIDTFLDQQRSFEFDVNAYNVQGDGIVNASRGGRGGGRIPPADRSWDALFYSGAEIVADGYSAEIAVPFKSIRYPGREREAPHQWGFQIVREIKSKNAENDVWAPMSRDVSGFMRQMGLLEGMTGLSTSRNLEFLPTFTAIQFGSLDDSTGGFVNRDTDPEAGLNVKYGVTSNLTADFTLNPDFSQIESDRPQIEVNRRFPLFFNELRPFFLEGAEIFDMPGPVTFVHTRTIVDPVWGAKLTGKTGKFTLGVMTANDEAPGNVGDATDPRHGETAQSVIGRVKYDVYSESHIGAIFTDRKFLNSSSLLGGVDGNFRLSRSASTNFRVIGTRHRDLDGVEREGHVYDASIRNNGRNLSWFAAAYEISPDFDTEVGFVRRIDQRRTSANIAYRWWPESWIINWGPRVSYARNWNFDGVLEDENASLGVNVNFAKSIRFNANVNRDMERFGGIDFFKTEYSIGGGVNTSRAFSIGGNFRSGDQIFFDASAPFLGTGTRAGVNVTLRPLARFSSRININTSRLTDPSNGDFAMFDVKIYRAESVFTFNDRLLMRNITEYNTFDKALDGNLLFTYRINAGTVFYFGYDDHYRQADQLEGDRDGDGIDEPLFFTKELRRTNRAIFMKLRYLFRY